MSFAENMFEARYSDGEAFDIAVDFHGDAQFFPVLYAGYLDENETEIFYITAGSADYEFDLYKVPAYVIDDYKMARYAPEGSFDFLGVDSLDEALAQL